MNRGQLLLEVLIALTILGLVAVAVVKVSIGSLKGSRVTGDRVEALNLAKQVLADVEKEREDDITAFFLRTDLEDDFISGDYAYKITYVFDGADKVTVQVLVTWDEGSVGLDKIFTKTRL